MTVAARSAPDEPKLDHAGLAAGFERALRARPEAVSTSYYRFGGRAARIRVVGDALAGEIVRPFAHLRLESQPDDAPELEVDLWDGEATGIQIGAAKLPALVPGASDVTTSPDERHVVYHAEQLATALDRAERRLVGWARAADRLTVYQRARPFTAPLLLWLMDRGITALHAGLVAHQGRGVLLGGPSGSGKTTTALACADAGLTYLGDDHIGLETGSSGTFVGHSLFASANVEPAHLRRFPALVSHAITGSLPEDDKSLLLLADTPCRLAAVAPISAIALPRVTGSSITTVHPASRAEALLRLAPSSLFLPHARKLKSTFERLARVVESVPSYWLDLGSDVGDIAPRVADMLALVPR